MDRMYAARGVPVSERDLQCGACASKRGSNYPCLNGNGVRRRGKHHATPKPRDVLFDDLFDDLVRQTAAGTIVPVQFHTATKRQRFWVTSQDRDLLDELHNDDSRMPAVQQGESSGRASHNRPTCR
ncbi:hypothetical protein [Streptomyces milbemycinicus]|uniref:hypothetical protein n=1 Tax=Streptomyces milbemycinicus TaxID=476552 RepID=UPI003401D7A2